MNICQNDCSILSKMTSCNNEIQKGEIVISGWVQTMWKFIDEIEGER